MTLSALSVKEFWKLNFGHALTIILGALSLAVSHGKLEAKMETVTERLGKQEASVEELTKMGLINTVGQHERRLDSLESVANEFRETRADIRWIKQKLDTIHP